MNKLLECLKYCEEQNGIPKCKNCGLDKDMIDEALQERDKEMLRRDAPWLNAMIEDREKKALQEQRQHILSKLTELSINVFNSAIVSLYVPYISKKSPLTEFSILSPNCSNSGVCGTVIVVFGDSK
jgi:hypothetical protein